MIRKFIAERENENSVHKSSVSDRLQDPHPGAKAHRLDCDYNRSVENQPLPVRLFAKGGSDNSAESPG